MPMYKRKSGGSSSSRYKFARALGGYSTGGIRAARLLAVRKGAPFGYRKSGYRYNKARAIGGGSRQVAKFLDTDLGILTASQTENIVLLNTVSQGTDENQRLGRNIAMKSVQLRGKIQGNSAGVNAIARIMVVYDRQPNKLLPVIADIISATTVASLFSGFSNQNNRDRFAIIMDKSFGVIGASTSVSQDAIMTFNKFVKLPNLITNYDNSATTGVITTLTTGSLLFVTIGDTVAGTTSPVVTIDARLRFNDV